MAGSWGRRGTQMDVWCSVGKGNLFGMMGMS